MLAAGLVVVLIACGSSAAVEPQSTAAPDTVDPQELARTECVDSYLMDVEGMEAASDTQTAMRQLAYTYGTTSQRFRTVMDLFTAVYTSSFQIGSDAAHLALRSEIDRMCGAEPSQGSTTSVDDRLAVPNTRFGASPEEAAEGLVAAWANHDRQRAEEWATSDVSDMIAASSADPVLGSLDCSQGCRVEDTEGKVYALETSDFDGRYIVSDLTEVRPTAVEPSSDAATAQSTSLFTVTGQTINGVPIGSAWQQVDSKLGLDERYQRFGPELTHECSTDDSRVRWSTTGLAISLDPDLRMFGFILRAQTTESTGSVDGLPIDIAGTQIGWQATHAEVQAAFPDSSLDPLLGDMTVNVGDGLLAFGFIDDGLSVVRAGDFCSSGGVVTIGD